SAILRRRRPTCSSARSKQSRASAGRSSSKKISPRMTSSAGSSSSASSTACASAHRFCRTPRQRASAAPAAALGRLARHAARSNDSASPSCPRRIRPRPSAKQTSGRSGARRYAASKQSTAPAASPSARRRSPRSSSARHTSVTPRTSGECTIPGIRVANFLPVLVLVGGGGLLLACERPSPDAVERWRRAGDTDKLTGVLADRDLAPDLRARAAQALITVGDPKETLAALRRLPDAAAVAKPLLGLLWEDARLQSQLQVPTLPQIRAKDALYDLRDFDPPTVDGYLVDWITGYYEERAGFGIHQGEEILRTVGAKAAPKLIAAARETLDLGSVDGKYTPIADNHLRALALTG